jgi:hypothetical protein
MRKKIILLQVVTMFAFLVVFTNNKNIFALGAIVLNSLSLLMNIALELKYGRNKKDNDLSI